jgi:hypothetical protein
VVIKSEEKRSYAIFPPPSSLHYNTSGGEALYDALEPPLVLPGRMTLYSK